MEFSVPEMSCGHCTAAIEKAVKQADPAATINCDLSTRHVVISTSLPEAEMSAAIKQAGYESDAIATGLG